MGYTYCLRSIEKLNDLAVKIRARDLIVLVEICIYNDFFFHSACGHVNLHSLGGLGS